MNRYRYVDACLVVAGIASGLIGNYDSPVGQVSKIVPATYAFTIWALIYGTGLYFAWWLIRRSNVELGSGGHLLALSFFMSGLWVRVQSDIALQLVVVASNLVVVLAQAHVISKVSIPSRKDFIAVALPSGTLAGWLTLATAVTFSDGLNISFKSTATVATFTAVAVLCALSFATWVVPTQTYRLTLVWGLVGIVIEQYSQSAQVAAVAAVGALVAIWMISRMKIKPATL